MSLLRVGIEVRGIVQGVGFRPFIHRAVKDFGFTGWVRNSSEGADMELEGERGALYRFADTIRRDHPPLALIEAVTLTELEGLCNYQSFEIIQSDRGEKMLTLVSPDVGICPDCLRELRDPADRRYRYPFINCTNCGPRFTIIKSVPYDRATTSMAAFPMCPTCASEFKNIEDRRYHAQPDCCPTCGPRVFFLDGEGRELPGDAIENAREFVKSGKIIAVKGLGGMHLACLPDAPSAATLRLRKRRDEKPLAVMCADISSAEKICLISEDEALALSSHRKPIVLLRKRERGSLSHLSENDCIGVMLPYTPLHYLLLGDDIPCLVMTSANLSDTPIMFKNEEALSELQGIADGFLLHDRDIQTRCDDSLIRVFEGRDYPLRRSRGYVPYPLLLPTDSMLLACGAEQKASFCLSNRGHAFPSQHIGDLKNIETLSNYEQQIAHFEQLFDINPQAIACDLHPDYLSTAYAAERAEREKLPLLRVQHHHAHMASCMADNALTGDCLGVIWDGTGYGSDGAIWGGELLCGGYSDFCRLATIRPIPLPGGDVAVTDIWRIGAALLRDAGLEPSALFSDFDCKTVGLMLEKNLNCPQSSGMGRLFDGVCAILGIRESCSYEGQGAILLEAAAEDTEADYTAALEEKNGLCVFDWRPMIRQIALDRRGGLPAGISAGRFMNTLLNAAVSQCLAAREKTGLSRVVLSGGVFQNVYLLERLPRLLRARDFEVYTHSRVSTNDEGVSLGQLMILEASHVSCGSA
ncbi:MAG: carbamoyltransferase HypF [Oscillospiraceae bacterium]